MFYPATGYMWASAYPWGWLPYHYGSWAFIGGGVGWAWVPGETMAGAWYVQQFPGRSQVVEAAGGVDASQLSGFVGG